MKRNLLMFFLIFTFSFFLMNTRSSAKQLCTYSITEDDQNFISYFKKNIYKNDTYKDWFDNYKYVLIAVVGSSDCWSIQLSTKPFAVNTNKYNLFQSGAKFAEAMIKTDNHCQSCWFHIPFRVSTPSNLPYASLYFGNKLIYSNYDVPSFSINDDGTYTVNNDEVFFQRPSLSMAEAVQEIPTKMRIQARQVIPTAVFCLALLISLKILSRKLYLFLR